MSRVLIGQSYFLRFDPKLWNQRQPYPPLGALYAAACLEGRGHAVSLFDAMLAQSEQEWDDAVGRVRPRIAVLFEDNFNYLSKMCLSRMRQAAIRMIASARAHGCAVVVAGSDPTDHPEVFLAAGADIVILGEGERTLEETVDALSAPPTGRALDTIAGLALPPREHGGAVRRTSARPALADLDGLPSPAWHLVDLARYRDTWTRAHGRFSLNLATTRGCPFHCNWCAKPIWGQRYHAHSPERVVADLDVLVRTCGARHVWFADDILGLTPGWLARMADLVEQERLAVPFRCQTRADLVLREGEVDALARLGAEMVWLGAESGSQRVLDAMEKGVTVAQIEEATRRLRARGVGVGFFLQFGYPGETRQDIDATFDLVRRCQPDDIGISVAYPLPGTRFHERVRHELGTTDHWLDSADLAMLYRGPESTAFYRQLHAVLHVEFRARKAWSALRRRVGQGDAGWRTCGRHAAALLWHATRLPLERRRLGRLAGHETKGAPA